MDSPPVPLNFVMSPASKMLRGTTWRMNCRFYHPRIFHNFTLMTLMVLWILPIDINCVIPSCWYGGQVCRLLPFWASWWRTQTTTLLPPVQKAQAPKQKAAIGHRLTSCQVPIYCRSVVAFELKLIFIWSEFQYTTAHLIDQAPSEVQWSSMCTETAFARAKASEVLGCARHRVAVQSDGHTVGVARGVFRGISNLKVQPNLRQSGQISLSCLLFRCLPEDSSKSIFMPLRSCSKFLTAFLKSRSNLSIRICLECLDHVLETPGATYCHSYHNLE